MTKPVMLVTGSTGLIGSGVVQHFTKLDWTVIGVDNNQRAVFFGPDGDTRWNLVEVMRSCPHYVHYDLDVRDRALLEQLISEVKPDAIVHAAAQPSHDLAATIPFEDFDTNAVGTLNMLEATRRHAPRAIFVFLSTNKVYGDWPNSLPMQEGATRWEFARSEDQAGISECAPIDQSFHSVFGASKVAADIMVQEYARTFGLTTCCLRCGCLTGPQHSGVELHGFVSYLVRCNIEGRLYSINGYHGKQVRDNIHSVDVSRFIEQFINAPRPGEVYNLGGGFENSCSILEAFRIVEQLTGRRMMFEYRAQNRRGDHICYYSDLAKVRTHYPAWYLSKGLSDIFSEVVAGWVQRMRRDETKVRWSE